LIEGRAWSGRGQVVRVQVSTDGGMSWADAELGQADGAYAWRPWTYRWAASEEGEHEVCCMATDSAGNTQPLTPRWNAQGVCNNTVQRVNVVVGGQRPPQQPAADEPIK